LSLLRVMQREEKHVGKYKITIFYSEEGRPVGALIEGPRLTRPLYIAAAEHSAPRLPQSVRRLLRRYGFMLDGS